jgi:DMSO/TMAO reductase YedYZ heme-binding membrane subunit
MVYSSGKSTIEMKRFFILIFLWFYAYAIIRYHFGKNVSWNEWYFILNKAFAWTGFTLICLSVLQEKWLNKIEVTRKELGIQGFIFALIHAISVLFLFNSDHYPKFYTNDIINSLGWIVIALGLLSIFIFSLPFFASITNKPSTSKVFKLGKMGVLVGVFHPLLIGYNGWFSPNEWPFYMPPITLLAVVFCLFIFSLRIVLKNK